MFIGKLCEVDAAVCNSTEETRCLHGGVCKEGPGIAFNCVCLPGKASHVHLQNVNIHRHSIIFKDSASWDFCHYSLWFYWSIYVDNSDWF